eukprot:g3033.t1
MKLIWFEVKMGKTGGEGSTILATRRGAQLLGIQGYELCSFLTECVISRNNYTWYVDWLHTGPVKYSLENSLCKKRSNEP